MKKRKILGALLCAAIAAAMLSGCGDFSGSQPTSTTSSPTTVSQTTAAQEEETTMPETTTQTEPTSPAVTESFAQGVYNNGQFTITLPDGWTYDESTGIPLFFSPDEAVNGIKTNLNIVVTKEIEGMMDISEDEYKQSMELMYGTGVELKDFAKKDIGGHHTVYAEYSLTLNETTQLITQVIFNENGKCLTYTYTSGNDKQPAECLEIFKSIQLL